MARPSGGTLRRESAAVPRQASGAPGQAGRRRIPARSRFRRVLGIMSGTSLDGVDFASVRFDGEMPRLERLWSARFPPSLRARLLACAEGRATAWELAQVHHDLGRFYARAALHGLGSGERPSAVGLHGQTVLHAPDPVAPATLQLGEPAYLARAVGVPVVSNFRAADMAAGGQGAPLATLFHGRVFARRGSHVCVQNLGGIGNVTSLEWTGPELQVLAFDTGPGNMPLDGAMARLSRGRLRMDRGGRMASRGVSDEALVRAWLRHAFLRRSPPKSTGREAFGRVWLDRAWREMDRRGLSAEDRMTTLTEWVARSVEENYRRHLPCLPQQVIVCGGGSRNCEWLWRFRAALAQDGGCVEVRSCEALGWPASAVEPAAFALLAREHLLGRPGTLPQTTGASEAVVCGQVTPPP